MSEKQPFLCSGCPGGWCDGCVPDEQAAFDEYMWTFIRLWCDAALASLRRSGWCYPLPRAWSSVCGMLARCHCGRGLTSQEEAFVWNSLLEAGYPGSEGIRKMKV